MELRDFAEQVLFSADLDQKLFAPEGFTDLHPGSPVAIPDAPGRPAVLPMVSRKPIPAAPTLASLERAEVRGQALHTFAHHELQAAELMALALLRFPDAPAAFRMGLARILCDEQRHFRMYRARAEAWGVGLGEVGAGHFFWDTVYDLPDASSFLAALSLTYEQANLDFTLFWKRAFDAVGDPSSVAVLNTVYEDEIRHVEHGLHWYTRFQGGFDFERYRASLRFPLSPGRAKGPIFDREGRARAGLPEDFVDEVELHNVSRGRPPRVFSFDPFVEEEVAGRAVKGRMTALQRDLASLPMFLAHKEDVVLAERPSTATLQALHHAGFAIPEFLTDVADLGERVVGDWRPWGWSPALAGRRGRLWDPGHAALYDKTWAFAQRVAWQERAAPSSLLEPIRGAICATAAQVEALVDGGDWVAKAPYSSSGQHRVRLSSPMDERVRGWLERHLAEGPVLVEPWEERVLDLSVQVEVFEDHVKLLGLTRFWTVGSGAYRGAVIGPWSQGLAPEVARVVHPGGLAELLQDATTTVAERARELGHRGPLGVDAMLYRTPAGLRLNPVLEVNPRYTMGRIALELRSRCHGYGGWHFLRRAQLAKAGYATVEALVERVRALPVERVDAGLARGVLFTNEPHADAQVLTLLCVAPTWQQAEEQWRALGFGT